MKHFLFLVSVVFFVSCSHLENFKNPKQKLMVHSLTSVSLSKKDIIELPTFQRDLSQMSASATRGARPQSYVLPVPLKQSDVHHNFLIPSIGSGMALYDSKRFSRIWNFPVKIGVSSTPAVSEDAVYFAGLDAHVYKVKAQSGELIWKKEISAESHGAAILANSMLYVSASDDSLWALDAATSKALWTYKRPSPSDVVFWSLRGQAQALLSPDKRFLYLGFSDGVFVKLNALNGETVWEQSFKRKGRFQDADTGVSFHKAASQVLLSLPDAEVVALDAESGKNLWSLPNSSGAQAYSENEEVFYSTASREVKCIFAKSQAVKWSLELKERGIASQITPLGEDYLLFSTTDYGVHIADKKSGEILWEKYLGPGIVSGVYVDAKNFYVIAPNNYLHRFYAEI